MKNRIDMVKYRWMIAAAAATVAVVGAALAATVNTETAPSVTAKDRAQIEAVVRDYILTHPEIIPEAVTRLREKQANQTYQTNRPALEAPFASAWAGAATGDVTMVMFSDYACGYCRASLPAVEQLLKEDHGLKVVWREIPILGAGSETAARAALAAAQQGAFVDFHTRMFAAGRPDEAKVNAVLRGMKIDLPRAQRDMQSATTTQELRSNMELVSRIDENVATPTFIIGGQTLRGAVGYETLKQAIADARKKARAAA